MFDAMKLSIQYPNIKTYLIDTKKYSEKEAIRLIEKLKNSDIQIRKMFIIWFKTGVLPTEKIENITIADIMKYRRTDEIKSFLILDWLIRDPVNAKAALMSGCDEIIPKKVPQNTDLPNTTENDEDVTV